MARLTKDARKLGTQAPGAGADPETGQETPLQQAARAVRCAAWAAGVAMCLATQSTPGPFVALLQVGVGALAMYPLFLLCLPDIKLDCSLGWLHATRCLSRHSVGRNQQHCAC